MATWVYLFGCLLLALYGLLWMRTRRARALLAHLPSVPELPFVGHMALFHGGAEAIFQQVDKASIISDEKGKPFVFWAGPVPILLCHDPDDVKIIGNHLLEKVYYYDFAKPYLGNGLVTAPASHWKKNVKKISGVFTTSVVEGYQDVFNAQARALVDALRTTAGAPPFDVQHNMAYTTLDTICQTAFGEERISDSVGAEEYYTAFNRTMELIILRGLNLLTHLDCVYKLTRAHKELLKHIGVLNNVSETVMEKRKLEREQTKSESQAPTKYAKFRSVLDILLDLGDTDPEFTEQHIKSEMNTLILGGQETVASTLTFALLMMGCKPGVQTKLYEEMRSIFGRSTRPVEKEDLDRMVYCEAAINETLRLYPPVPVVIRYADKEVQLKSCTAPVGSGCGINIWGAGRSERSWGPDAREYRPERWLGGEVPATAATFLPFSYGRRSCIGKRYAMKLIKTVLAYCLRELEFTSEADKLEFKLDVSLRPVKGHLLQVKLRE